MVYALHEAMYILSASDVRSVSDDDLNIKCVSFLCATQKSVDDDDDDDVKKVYAE